MLPWVNPAMHCFASDEGHANGRLSMKNIVNRLALILGRSLIPFLALLIIGGTVLWGPWVTLVLAVGLWYSVGHLV
jgi:hypothetical protein